MNTIAGFVYLALAVLAAIKKPDGDSSIESVYYMVSFCGWMIMAMLCLKKCDCKGERR